MTVPGAPTDWRRLDARMLLVHPLETLIRALPAVLAIVIARAGSDSDQPWELLAVPVILAFGALRWLTTRYRVSNGQIELRRGLVTKQTTTARLDRVRTVDLTAKIYHRILGLAKVEISTGGSSKERLVLDSLRVAEGRRLRAELLHRIDPVLAGLPAPSGHPVAADEIDDRPTGADSAVRADGALRGGDEVSGDGGDGGDGFPCGGAGDVELVRLDPAWVRFAPLTATGLASAAAVVGFATQGLQRIGDEAHVLRSAARWVRSLAWWMDVALVVVAVSLLAVAAYVLTFWGFRLTRNELGSLHTRRGLLTTRETSIDHARVRGVRLDEPLGLRLAGGRRLKVVTTGLGHERGGADWLCPPAPGRVVTELARDIVADEPAVDAELPRHGSVARRRRLTRTLVPTAVVVAFLLVGRLVWGWHPAWLALAVLLPVAATVLALDRYAGLGHLVTPRHLVARQGSLDRRRIVLDRMGIIGWKVEQSFFQRRLGVATVVATTAAGDQHYDVVDVTLERAYAVIAEISPDLLAEFG